jgi:hypothetical protein
MNPLALSYGGVPVPWVASWSAAPRTRNWLRS